MSIVGTVMAERGGITYRDHTTDRFIVAAFGGYSR